MAPALEPALIGREMAACAVLGAVLGSARALFPEKGRAAFLPDVLFVGALLMGLQSYAACLSAGGVLRWYQGTAAAAAALAAGKLLGGPMQLLRRVLWMPVRRLAAACKTRCRRAKERRNAKRTAKTPKKNLPRPQRMLYNSNVSKEYHRRIGPADFRGH